MSLATLFEPGAMAQPTNDRVEHPTINNFRAWKVSEADAMMGEKTAWTSESAFGTQVSADVFPRSARMYESYAVLDRAFHDASVSNSPRLEVLSGQTPGRSSGEA